MKTYNLRAVLSDKCNYSCVFCSHDFNRSVNLDIDPDFLKECVKVFASLGGKKVTYTGGEPLIYPALYEIMRLAKSLGLKNSITTNGSMISRQTEEFYGLADALNISIPSFEPEIYKKLTGLKIPLEIIKENALKASEHGLKVKINTVYTRQNEKMINMMINFFSPHGIVIKLMNDMIADENYYIEFLEFAEKFRGDSRVEIESGKNPGLEICSSCKIPHPTGCPSCRSIWVYPDKRITLCPFDNTGYDDIFSQISKLMKS